MKRLFFPLVCLLFFTVGSAAIAKDTPSTFREVTTLGGITEYKMDNGLRVLLFPDSTTARTTVNVTYMVGSRHEGYGETGMAHLLEHLLFKGTPTHPNIPQELSERGASANGTTWYDRTNYYETFPASQENLEWALALEADRMVNSHVAKKDLDSEMTVVRNEFEQGENNPTGILNERIFSTSYLWHNYGNSTIGARSDIENVPIEKLQAFYRKYYQPDNALLIVAGKFDRDHALQEIEKTFGAIPKPDRVLSTHYTVEPAQDGERFVELERSGDVKVVGLAYHIPAGTHPDFPAIDILGDILADTPSGRLYKKLVATKLATNVSGGAYQLHDPGLLYFSATTRKDSDLARLEEALIETAESFLLEPPTEEEVERAKTRYLKSFENSQRHSSALALNLSEWQAMGDWRFFFLYQDRLKEVTVDDVKEAAKTYLKSNNRTIGRFIPSDSPDRVAVPQVDSAALHQALDELVVEDSFASGEEFDSTPENIAAHTIYKKVGNLDIALLPRQTRGSVVNISMSFPFGNLESIQNKDGIAGMTSAMLMRGTTSMTREQIKDKLVNLSASGSVGGGYTSASSNFSTTRENVPELFSMIADLLQNPSFPEEEFELLKESSLASIEASKANPASRASKVIAKELDPFPKSDPRRATTLDEDKEITESVTLDQVKEFYNQFYGANRGQIAIVGDFDPDEVLELIETHIAPWINEGAPEYKRVEDLAKKDVEGKKFDIFVPDKTSAVYFAYHQLYIDDQHPDYAALRLGNYLLGGGFLNSRLATRVRQTEGLSYSISTQLSADQLDPVGVFAVGANAAPENIDALEKAILEELHRAFDEGFTEKEVEAAKRGYLETLKVGRNNNSAVASLLRSYMYIDRDVLALVDWDNKIASLTPDEIREALVKHIDLEKLVVARAGTLPGH